MPKWNRGITPVHLPLKQYMRMITGLGTNNFFFYITTPFLFNQYMATLWFPMSAHDKIIVFDGF